MWEQLDLSESHVINKEFDVDSFCQTANLTEREISTLKSRVQSITIDYDFVAKDGLEIVLYDVLIDLRIDKWTEKQIAGIVARSFPLRCLVYVHTADAGSISAFITHDNSKTKGRMVIDSQSTSPIFQFENESLLDIKMIEKISSSFDPNCDGEEILNNIYLTIEKWKETQEGIKSLLHQQSERDSEVFGMLETGLRDRYLMFIRRSNDESEEDEDDEDIIDDGEVKTSYIYDCEGLCRVAYYYFINQLSEELSISVSEARFTSGDFDEIEWLSWFGRMCQKALYRYSGRKLPHDFYYVLGGYFGKNEYEDPKDLLDEDLEFALEEAMEDDW